MIVSLLVAMDQEGGIGLNGGLPWHISSDLKRFKSLTTGHHVIMGRKTYETIAKPLPDRIMVVISRNPHYRAEGCLIVDSLDQALELAEENGEEEAFVIGGAEIFALALPRADKIYLTVVKAVTVVDTYFPDFDLSEWERGEPVSFPAGGRDEYASKFYILTRKRS